MSAVMHAKIGLELRSPALLPNLPTSLVPAERLSGHDPAQTIVNIAALVERNDPQTALHQNRVADLSVAIGAQMGLRSHLLGLIRLGAMIHDVGMLGLPSELAALPVRLNAVEMAVVHRHAAAGQQLIRDLDLSGTVAAIVRHHHERMDGTGPAGLHEREFPMEARIVAIADVVEAMSNERPYRAGHGVAVALDEIRIGRGSRYDSDAADACRAVMSNGFRFG